MFVTDAARIVAEDPSTPPLARQAFARFLELLETEDAPWQGEPTPPPPTIVVYRDDTPVKSHRSEERPGRRLQEPVRRTEETPNG